MSVAATPLQLRLCALLRLLDESRVELTAREYECVLDVLAARIAHDCILRLRLLDRSDDEEAA